MTKKLIGLNNVTKEITEVCNSQLLYTIFQNKVPHYLIPLSSGEGRTTIIKYLVESFKVNNILPFDSNHDHYLEFKLDGNLSQLREVFYQIEDAAIYKAHYTGIVSIDISALAYHKSETQYTEFIDKCKEFGQHCTFIFFTNSSPTNNEVALGHDLMDKMNNIKIIKTSPYTHNQLISIIVDNIKSNAITISNEKELKDLLLLEIEKNNICTVKQTKEIITKLSPCITKKSNKLILVPGKLTTKTKEGKAGR